jgi:hypothetical protein
MYYPLPRVCQASEAHCGPAVLEILLARLGVDARQERLVDLALARGTLEACGTRVDQLALATRRLGAGVCFWYKNQSTPEDLITVVSRYHYPVGVEWQGLFEEREEDEEEGDDCGHYSIVTHIDRLQGLVTIADPYIDFCDQDRVFPFDWFIKRWWDTNEVPDPMTGQPRLLEDRHMMFVVARPRVRFPARLGMVSA